MDSGNPKSTARIGNHPIHPMLIPFPIVFFVTTLVSDIVLTQTGDSFWARVSTWLLIAGLVMAALAALAGLTDFLGSRAIRAIRPAWYHMIGNVIAVVLSAINLAVHLRGPEAIASTGLPISAVVMLLLLFNGWMGWELVYRHRVGVADRSDA